MILPPVARVRQKFERPRVDDIPGAVQTVIRSSRLASRVGAGGRIAVAAGQVIDPVRSAVMGALSDLGYRPFEVGAGAEAVVLGAAPNGLPIHFDSAAAAADGLVLVNRVRPATEVQAHEVNGLLELLVIGLGGREAAESVRRFGLRGLREVLPAMGRFLVDHTPFALGLAVVEGAGEGPSEIVGVEPEMIFEIEPRLRALALERMARLPFEQLDVLVVGELGTNYSASGIDPHVIGRVMIETQADLPSPKITRLAVLDVADESRGNAVGAGFADITTRRLVRRIDREASRADALAAGLLERARIPLDLPTDREVFEMALDTCWKMDPAAARLAIIPNTLELDTLWISPALEAEARAHAGLDVESGFESLPFDGDGTLDQRALFPSSTRARRRS